MPSSIKKIISFAALVVSCVLPIFIFMIFVVQFGDSIGATLSTLVWIIFAFLSGVLMASSRNIYPFAVAFLTDVKRGQKEKTSRMIFTFTLGVTFALLSFGLALSILGGGLNYSISSSLKIYLYLLLGIIGYFISLSGFRFFSIEKIKKYPNVFNRKLSFLAVFFISFLSVFVDIIPSTLFISGEAFLRGNIYFGFIIFLSHAIGRVVPIYALETISRFKINGIQYLEQSKNRIKNAANTLLVIVSSIVINVGIIILIQNNIDKISSGYLLDFLYDGWLLTMLILIPYWVKFFIEENRVFRSPLLQFNHITSKIKDIELECINLNHLYNFNEKKIGEKLLELKHRLNVLTYDSKIIESSIRHSARYPIRGFADQKVEEKKLRKRLIRTIVLTLVVITVISIIVL